MERRLAAILAADVVGYSRLMEVDEEATARTLSTYREIVEGLVASHHGRVFGSAGDSIIAEFASPVEAVRCAVDIQRELEAHNADLPEDRRMRLRIGVNLGDVMVEGDNLLGDGVNIAARLETLAEPGGISLARSVFDQVKKQLDLGYENLGEHEVKNIAEPVQVYRVLTGPEAAGKVMGETTRATQSWRRVALAAAAAVLIGVAGAVTWLRPWEPTIEPAPVERMVSPLPDRPSIAVLPFVNLSDDPAQEYFADGMTEDLITDLSKISDLTVISRTSTSGYKGREIDIREVGEALNVRYVIEGSVRKVGEQVRINAQLIDATTGGHLWAERYDGSLNDIFGLQDRVLEKIVASLALELSGEERRRLADKGTDSVAAHDLYLRGLFQESTFTREGSQEAMQLYEQALSIDPGYALAYTRIANILELSARNGWSDDVQADLTKAVELNETAVALDPQNPRIHWSLGRSVSRLGTPEALQRGIESLERAIELDPDFADAYAFLTVLYVGDGRAEDGLRSVETAMRLNPRYPFWYLFMRGMTRFVVEDYDSAIADFEAAADRSPTAPFVRWWLAASYAQAGRQDDAEWQVEEMQMMGFEGTIAIIVETSQIQDPGYLLLYEAGLRKAGIPE
ncbi:MAG: adenylate/guanylate cyclase domain-containing protein [Kiloniellales bacterium]